MFLLATLAGAIAWLAKVEQRLREKCQSISAFVISGLEYIFGYLEFSKIHLRTSSAVAFGK